MPTIGQQNRIVKVIHGITRKIENNKRINDNLEQQIKTIFTLLNISQVKIQVRLRLII